MLEHSAVDRIARAVPARQRHARAEAAHKRAGYRRARPHRAIGYRARPWVIGAIVAFAATGMPLARRGGRRRGAAAVRR